MIETVLFAGGMLTTVLLGLAVVGGSYALADRLVPQGTSARLCGTGALSLWGLCALFWVLAPLGIFRTWVVLPLLGAFCLLAARSAPSGLGERLQRDRRRTASVFREAGWALIPLGLVVLVALAMTFRGLAAPPLAWDALTYHLVHAGRFIQDGGLLRHPAPDAWSYYEYFPPSGEILFAWSMLATRSAALVPGMGFAIFVLLLVGVYAAAREMGAPIRRAVLTATAVGSSPSLLSLVTSAYVDPLVGATLAIGALFLFRFFRTRAASDLALGAAALSVLASAKHPGVVFFGVFAAFAAFGIVGRGKSVRELARVALPALALSLVGAAHYARTWWETGNPFYPVSVSLLGFPGNDEFELLQSAKLFPGAVFPPPGELIARMLTGSAASGWPHRNLGPGAAVLAAMAALGSVRLARESRTRHVLFLLVVLGLNVAMLSSPRVAALRLQWWDVSGRYLAPALLAAALLAAGWRRPVIDVLLAAESVVSVVYAFPVGLGPLGWAQAGLVAALVLFVVLIARLGWALWGRLAASGVLLAVALMLAAGALHEIRRYARLPTWREAYSERTFDVHPLHLWAMTAYPLWEMLAEEERQKVAVTAGWDGIGHNWYLFPLFGDKLQHDVSYVPVTRSGAIKDYRDKAAVLEDLDLEAWYRRLAAGGIDLVVVLPPLDTPELAYISAHPERFRLVAAGVGGQALAFRIFGDDDSPRSSRTAGAGR